MYKGKSIICVIPARLASLRFPKKMIAPLGGKPLLQWAYEGAASVSFFDEVIVAVDSQELYDLVEGFGGYPYLTSPDCENGTMRLVELQNRGASDCEIWVNWQGDEPFLRESTLATLLQSCDDEEGEVWTLKRKILEPNLLESKDVVKVVDDHEGRALYFSRSCIPSNQENIYKHVGLYAYTRDALEKIGKLPPCELEKQEDLEQLRFLYYQMRIDVHETDQEIFGIDTKEELAIAEQMCYSF